MKPIKFWAFPLLKRSWPTFPDSAAVTTPENSGTQCHKTEFVVAKKWETYPQIAS